MVYRATDFRLLTIFLVLITRTTCAYDVVVYYGSSYERSFSKPGTESITIEWNGQQLTNSSTPVTGNWYVEDNSIEDMSVIIVRNDNITASTPPRFMLKITSATAALITYEYRVMDASATSDFILLATEMDVRAFTLTCNHNASGLAPIFETLTDLYWTFGDGTDPDVTKLSSFETKQNHLQITRDGATSSLTVSRTDSEVKFSVEEPLAAYAGIYSCHVIVSNVPSTTTHGIVSVNVYAKPHSTIHQKREQFMSDEDADILCVVYGFPPPAVNWSFSARKQGEPVDSDKEIRELEGDEKHVFTDDEDQIARNYELKNTNTGVKSLLIVKEADNLLDRGVYMCEGENAHGMSHTKFYMRVRYKYGWIYPFVGIIVEVVIVALCVLICGKTSSVTITQSGNVKIYEIAAQPSETISLPPEGLMERRMTSLPNTPPLSLVGREPNHEIPSELINKDYNLHELSKVIVEDSEDPMAKKAK